MQWTRRRCWLPPWTPPAGSESTATAFQTRQITAFLAATPQAAPSAVHDYRRGAASFNLYLGSENLYVASEKQPTPTTRRVRGILLAGQVASADLQRQTTPAQFEVARVDFFAEGSSSQVGCEGG